MSAEVDQVKIVLIEAVARRLRQQCETNRQAAALLECDPSLVSRLYGGEISRFSLATLIDWAHMLGAQIGVSVD